MITSSAREKRRERWRCPFCEHDATIGQGDVFDQTVEIRTAAEPNTFFAYHFVTCPNDACRKLVADAWMLRGVDHAGRIVFTTSGQPRWHLIPRGRARAFPEYIPEAIRSDYNEACLIVDDSPKASATLSRRCLQGMIRDVWDIRRSRLQDEIEALKDTVDPLTWKAIDAVRSVGNIGAHMEADVNLIVEVEPNEAEKLIMLVETLLAEWYVARHERERTLRDVVELAERKAVEKMAGRRSGDGDEPAGSKGDS